MFLKVHRLKVYDIVTFFTMEPRCNGVTAPLIAGSSGDLFLLKPPHDGVTRNWPRWPNPHWAGEENDVERRL